MPAKVPFFRRSSGSSALQFQPRLYMYEYYVQESCTVLDYLFSHYAPWDKMESPVLGAGCASEERRDGETVPG